MGADITIYKGGEEFYFRDSYNSTNLAWIIGLSYWQTKGNRKQECREFFRQLMNISDGEIVKHVKKLMKKESVEGTPNEWVEMFKEKREDIRKHWALIETCDRVSWSV